MDPCVYILGVTEVTSLVLGGAITYYAHRAYLRDRSAAIRAVMIGFASVTVGILLGLVLMGLERVDPLLGASVQGVFVTLGLGFLAYSLYVRDNRLSHGEVAAVAGGSLDRRDRGR
ncbi:MAG: hypothetical protein ABEJ40_00425 [Haloarculaceae archaeon]